MKRRVKKKKEKKKKRAIADSNVEFVIQYASKD